jgi:hypothetical protein
MRTIAGRHMRVRSVITLGAALLLVGVVAFMLRAEPIPEAPSAAPVVFVCRNGVAMSVWSAAYFNRLAAAHGLRERAISRAAIPSFNAVPWNMTFALAIDGFRLDGYRPRVISAADTDAAELVVAIDTELPPEARTPVSHAEVWQGFPPMREQYFPSRRALKARVEALVARLAMAGAVPGAVNP